MNDLLTIKEFAEKVGLYPQGIHTQTTNKKSRLYPYVVQQKGKKYIRKEALFEIYQITEDEQPPQSSKENQSPTNETNDKNQSPTNPTNQTTQPPPNPYEEVITILRQELEEKRQEIKEKDRIIEEMRISAEKEREHLRVLLDQEQHLHAQTRLRLNQYEGDTTQGTEGEQPKEETDTIQDPKKKRNRFMRWLFGEE